LPLSCQRSPRVRTDNVIAIQHAAPVTEVSVRASLLKFLPFGGLAREQEGLRVFSFAADLEGAEVLLLTEGHAGEFFLETLLLLRIAGARQAVGELEEALSFLLPGVEPDPQENHLVTSAVARRWGRGEHEIPRELQSGAAPLGKTLNRESGGRERKGHLPRRFRASALIPSHDTTSSGFAWWSSRRRSSSVRCASVSGTAALSAAMLSQISSTSARRSSTQSRSIPSDFMDAPMACLACV